MTQLTHLLSASDLSKEQAAALLSRAGEHFSANQNKGGDKKNPTLKGRTLFNLFYENSTRTRSSFELAGKRLGMDVINMSVATSSIKKGESLMDTAMTLNAMQADAIVVRHQASGTAKLFTEFVDAAVVNAGDGAREHPSQALLDAFTIQQNKGEIAGLKVAICGDIMHSRVARSNAALLTTLGAEVTLIAPPTLMPQHVEVFGVKHTFDMREGIAGADIVMMLRIQEERMKGPYLGSVDEYFELYGLNHEKLALAADDALVMHPGPVNRGVEIATDVLDDASVSVVLNQVEAGVAVRMAILESVISNASEASGEIL